MSKIKIIEIRYTQSLPLQKWFVTLFFDDRTSSTFEYGFNTEKEANIFIIGLESGIDWIESVNSQAP